MVDACIVTRETGRVFDEDTGLYVITAGTVYEGPCRVRSATNLQANEVNAEERTVTLHEFVVFLPIDSTALVDDVVTVTASTLDPFLVGVPLHVRDVTKSSHLTSRRLICQERET